MLHFVADRVKRDGFDADGMSPPFLVVRLSRKKHPPGQRSWRGCLQLGLSRLRLERAILIDELDLLAQPSTDHGVVNIEAASTGNINLDWTLGGSGYRHVWVHRNGGLFFGAAKESDQGDSGVQSIGSAMVDVTPGDSFEPIASHTSGSARNVDHDETHLVRDRGGGVTVRT